MKLHYAGSHADWEAVAPADRNVLQRLAARSNGILTLGNLVSVSGLLLVIFGLLAMTSGRFWQGLGYVILGRLADILDGTLADRTGTKGPVGEAVDAVLDKVAVVAVLASFLYHNWLPIFPLVCIALQMTVSSTLAFTAHVRHIKIHASAKGKIATVFAWVLLFLFAAATALNRAGHHAVFITLMAVGYVLLVVFIAWGTTAAVGYFRDATAGLPRPVFSAIVATTTSIRIVCAVAILLVAASHRWILLLPFAVAAFASDFLDGWLARRWEVVSTFGMAFDPLADKVVCLALLAVAAVYVQGWYWVLFAIFAVYDTFTTLTRFTLSRPMPASKLAKLKTAVLMVGLISMIIGVYVGAVAWIAAILITIAAALTVRSFIEYVRSLGRTLTWLEYSPGVTSIDFASWHAQYGVRAVLFDVDGTLAPWNTPRVDEDVKAALRLARKAGIVHVGLVSNMGHHRAEHLRAVAEQVGASTYRAPSNHGERKPSPIMIHAALHNINVTPDKAAFVGDKILDVLAARRAGVARVAWVERLGSSDHILDRLLYRPIEKLIKWTIR